jgi:hypothetical protein
MNLLRAWIRHFREVHADSLQSAEFKMACGRFANIPIRRAETCLACSQFLIRLERDEERTKRTISDIRWFYGRGLQ